MNHFNKNGFGLHLAVLVVTLLGHSMLAQAAKPQELTWEDLVPASDVFSFSQQQQSNEPALSHDTFGAQQNGTVVTELDGQRVKIPAFVVPLDGDENTLTELLLVPYFGACIHVPPPPSNQIIYFNSDEKSIDVTKLDLYRPVWATGVLKTEDTDHELAQIGYRMEIETLEEYRIN